MVAPLFILPHIVHLQGIDNLHSGFKCKQMMVAPISILSHIAPYCSPLSLKFPHYEILVTAQRPNFPFPFGFDGDLDWDLGWGLSIN